MGFTWAQSSEALKTHATLEEAVESLFGGDCNPGTGGKCLKMFLKDDTSLQYWILWSFVCWLSLELGASKEIADQPLVQEAAEDEGEWIVRQTSRPRALQIRDIDAQDQNRSKSQSQTPRSRNSVKP